MAVNKITPRALDKSTDYKLVPSTAFIDAVNVVMTDEEAVEGFEYGDVGVIKNLRGTSALGFHTEKDVIAEGDFKIIGSATDHKLKLIYFFVYHEDMSQQGVWVYDPYGRLSLPVKYAQYYKDTNGIPDLTLTDIDPYRQGAIKCVAKGDFFNFDQHSVVQGSVIYGNTLNLPPLVVESLRGENNSFTVNVSDKQTFEKDFHLYFTDNKNEPKKLNVAPSMFGRYLAESSDATYQTQFISDEGGYFSVPANSSSDIEKIKFCHACKPTPLSRPTFDWIEDTSSRANNFEKSEGFKFAYQVVYNDGSTSAISPKSQIAVTPSLLFQGANKNPDHALYNVCQIFISSEIFSGNWTGVKQVNILAQEGIGPYKIIHEAKQLDGDVIFRFKNDVVGIPVSEKEENKFFDSVPQKAEAQAVVDNRLMYGNYMEGYPNQDISATLQVQYAERGSENFANPIKIEKSVILDLFDETGGDVNQKMSGFRVTIEDGDFPAMGQGDTLTFSLKFLPEKNFHLYDAEDSYHQSRHLGVENSDEGNQYFQTPEEAGAKNLLPHGGSNPVTTVFDDWKPSFNAFKENGGVASVYWNTVDSRGTLPPGRQLGLGTSAANPFIVPSKALSFQIQLRCLLDDVDSDILREYFFDIFDRVMASRGANGIIYDGAPNAFFEVVSETPYSTIEWDLNLTNGQKFEEGDERSKLISMLSDSEIDGRPRCRGAVIANKGQATFGLRKAEIEESAQDLVYQDNFLNNKSREYKIYLDNIPKDGLELWTCVRKWLPRSPWWVLNPTFLGAVSNEQASLDSFYSLSEYETGVNENALEIFQNGESFPYFKQRNDVRDFVPNQGDIFIFNQPGAGAVYEAAIRGDHADVNITLNTCVGYVQNLNTLYGSGDYNYFIASPCPKDLFGGSVTNIPDSRAKFYSLADGEGGPGGSLPPTENLPSGFEHPEYSDGINPIYKGLNFASSAWGLLTYDGATVNLKAPRFMGPWFTGKIWSNVHNDGSLTIEAGGGSDGEDYGYRTTMPLIQGTDEGLHSGPPQTVIQTLQPLEYVYSDRAADSPFGESVGWDEYDKLNFSFALENTQIEFLTLPVFQVQAAVGGLVGDNRFRRSFKSSCDHDFGIVFYDNHGRRSFVNPLGSVYVGGFSDSERGGNKGTASVQINLGGAPPRWASKYQVVYGGNKSTSNFIQYTTNNAFIEPTNQGADDLDVLQENGKIYVSLNLLQSSSISHAKEFGARGEDGSLSIYKFSEGDKLRVISYGDDDNRQYPESAVFDIIELINLDGTDNNPLINDLEQLVGAEKLGDFVVLTNNEAAAAFSFSSLLSGGSAWNQNVVFEIFSPQKTTGVEFQVYEEIGDVYDVVPNAVGQPAFSQNPIVATEGDVFFRPKAANVNTHENAVWTDIMSLDEDGLDGNTDVVSNFQNVLMESSRATDLFPSKIKAIGRSNVASTNAKTVRREAGIIYSEKSNPESDTFNYSSFNASLFPFKDLEERFGNINFMDELGGNLFVIQQDRCTKVPVSSTMLSNAVGQEQLIASNDILGKEQVFSVTAGCDNNPESVVRIDNTYYFAHKSSGKVFRFVDGQGLENISDVQMSSYLRSKFRRAISQSSSNSNNDVRIVGGYDPVKQEYLLTVLEPADVSQTTSDDSTNVLGCTDPNAINYNSEANVNDGSCVYVDSSIACMRSPDTNDAGFGIYAFPNTPQGEVATHQFVVSNVGGQTLVLQEPVLNAANNLGLNAFSATLQDYSVAPGEFTTLTVQALSNAVGVAETQIVLSAANSEEEGGCLSQLNFDVSANIVASDNIPEDFVDVDIYLGGTLIDQQFVSLGQGIWTITIDQNSVIQTASNSFSGIGPRALLEAEISIPASPAPVLDSDKIEISGTIDNVSPELRFTQAPDAEFSELVEDKKFEFSIDASQVPLTELGSQSQGIRIPICTVNFPEITSGIDVFDVDEATEAQGGNQGIYDIGQITFQKVTSMEHYRLSTAVGTQDEEELVLNNQAQVTLVSTPIEESTFNIANLDKDQNGIISSDDIDALFANIPFYNTALDLNGDGIVDEEDYLLAREYIGQLVPATTDDGTLPDVPGLVLDLSCYTYQEGDAVWRDQTENDYHFLAGTGETPLPIKNSDGSITVGRGPLAQTLVEEFDESQLNDLRFFVRPGVEFDQDGTITRRDKFIPDTDQNFSYEFIFRYTKQPMETYIDNSGIGDVPGGAGASEVGFYFQKEDDIFRGHGQINYNAAFDAVGLGTSLMGASGYVPGEAYTTSEDDNSYACSKFIGYNSYASGGWSFGTRYSNSAVAGASNVHFTPYEGLASSCYFGQGDGASSLQGQYGSHGNLDLSVSGYDYGIQNTYGQNFNGTGALAAGISVDASEQEVMNVVQVSVDCENSVAKMYINGVLRSTNTTKVGIGLPNINDFDLNSEVVSGLGPGNFLIGKSCQGGWKSPRGIDVYMLRVYDVALNDDTIQENYQSYIQHYIPS